MYRIMTMLLALVLTAASAAVPFTHAAAEENTMNITIDLTAGGKPISPYIYGINQYGNQNKYKQVKATAVRQGRQPHHRLQLGEQRLQRRIGLEPLLRRQSGQ